MPIVTTQNDDWNGDPVQRYEPPRGSCYDWSEAAHTSLIAARRDYAAQIEGVAALQKELGKRGDRDGARSAKDLLRGWQKQERATTQVINWFAAESGPIHFRGWPLELASELDAAFRSYELVASLPTPVDARRE